jgi:diketogulonate reductase-like aldo/keto reductase
MNITNIQGTVELSNGINMPYLGLGTYLTPEGSETINAVTAALEAGYRHFDTAAIYGNEVGVGKAIKESNIARSDIFITTKLWNSKQGYDSTLRAFDNSLDALGIDYLDLYLIHWPTKGKYKETWRAFEKLSRDGRIKAIGVSNFHIHHLEDLLTTAEIVPMVNQVEFHPYLLQKPLTDFCIKHKIQYESWSPLMQGKITSVELLNTLAQKYNKTEAQIVIRWNLQKGVIVIPKSIKKDRIISNAQVFDFNLNDDDVKAIDTLDKSFRFGANPDNFNF